MTPRYSTIDVEGQDTVCFVIKEGPFEDVVYRYDIVSIAEVDDGTGDATLRFNYIIVEDHGVESPFSGDPRFEQTIGDILVDVIEKEAVRKQTKGNDDGEN